MHIINDLTETTFLFDGIEYKKNYISTVAGNRVKIFNCYEKKDVLMPLEHFSQVTVNDAIYTSAAALQSALLNIIYSRVNMGEGTAFNQNNIFKSVSLGFAFNNPTTADVVARMNQRTTVISVFDTPVIITLSTHPTQVIIPGLSTDTSKKLIYFFKPGKGTYGATGTPVTADMLFQIASLNLAPADIDPDSIRNLDPVVDGDFVAKANQSPWDFSDSQSETETGVKEYYFTYTDAEGVLNFALFIGTPGMYGLGYTQFTEDMFVITTNSNVTPEKTKLSEFENDVPFATVGQVNGLTITTNQASAEMYLKNSAGTTLATVNLGYLNNEGTTFFYNDATQKLQLKNDAGEILSEIPVSAFVTNLIHSVDFNGATPYNLEFKDAAGGVVDSVTVTINNVQGLQTALDNKANKNGSNVNGNWPIDISGNAATAAQATNATNWGGKPADFDPEGSNLVNPVGIDNSGIGRRFTLSIFKSWLSLAVSDVAGLIAQLAGKAPLNGNGTSGTWPINISGGSNSTANWGGIGADFGFDGGTLSRLMGIDGDGIGRKYTAANIKIWLDLVNTYITKSGAVTISDTKTFLDSPIVPNATLNAHAINWGQVKSERATIYVGTTGSINISVPANSSIIQPIDVNGADIGDYPTLITPQSAAGLVFTPNVITANQVSVRIENVKSSTINLSGVEIKARIIKFPYS